MTWLEQAQAAQLERKHALAALLTGREPTPGEHAADIGQERPVARGFDGGARQSLPPSPPTHEQWLSWVLAERRADVGVFFA